LFQSVNPFPHIESVPQNLANQYVPLKRFEVADEVSDWLRSWPLIAHRLSSAAASTSMGV
jgi:hypothetical protein